MSFNDLCMGLLNSIAFKNSILLYVRALLKNDDNFNFWTLNILTNDDFNIDEYNPNNMKDTLYLLILKQFYSKRFKEISRQISENNKIRYDKFITKLNSKLDNNELIENERIFRYIYRYIIDPEFRRKIFHHEPRYEIGDLFYDWVTYDEFIEDYNKIDKLIDKFRKFNNNIADDFKYIGKHRLFIQTDDTTSEDDVHELNEATEIIIANM